MELDRALYKKTFSRLQASPALREELISMTESTRRTKKFVLRRVLVTAAIMALAALIAIGANAATGGELYEVTFGKLLATETLCNGNTAYLYENEQGETHVIEEAEIVKVELDDGNIGLDIPVPPTSEVDGYAFKFGEDGALISGDFVLTDNETGYARHFYQDENGVYICEDWDVESWSPAEKD